MMSTSKLYVCVSGMQCIEELKYGYDDLSLVNIMLVYENLTWTSVRYLPSLSFTHCVCDKGQHY